MTWHFVNSTSSPDAAAAFSEGSSADMYQCAPLSWKSTLEGSCSNGKSTASSHGSQSGMTSKRSTESHGEEGSTSLLADSHARTSPAQERAQESPENEAGFGLRWPELSARYDRATSSWKIHPCLFEGDSIECSPTLPRWGMVRDGVLSALPTPALPTYESASGLWQTPVADDAIPRENGKWNSRGEPKLSAQVMMFPTPTKSMMTETDLEQSRFAGNSGRRPKYAAIRGGLLNPDWVEWLMGFPIGWTASKPLAMRKFRQWRRSHGKSLQETENE